MTNVDARPAIAGVLFDKDGTLLDFGATWDEAVGRALEASVALPEQLPGAARQLGYDLRSRRILPTSPFVAGTNAEVLDVLTGLVDLETFGRVVGDTAPVAAPGVQELLDHLDAAGLPYGVVTNDDEAIARAQMSALGWLGRFVCCIGADSGYGAKPEPGPVLAGCRELGVDPDRVLMVGDSSHDIDAGAAAGCATALVQPHATTGSVPMDPQASITVDRPDALIAWMR